MNHVTIKMPLWGTPWRSLEFAVIINLHAEFEVL